jgi:hypothetical protein
MIARISLPRISAPRIAVLLVLLVGGACDASTAPNDFVAEYALISLDAQALPVALPVGSPLDEAGTRVLADTLRLRADGTGVRIMRYGVGSTSAIVIVRDELRWRAIGDALEVSFPCDDVVLASCIAPPHLAGHFGAGMQWVIPSARIYNDAPAVYQRVGMR